MNEGILIKRLNAIKHKEFHWMSQVTKCAPQLAIKDNLNKAFQNFFRGLKEGQNMIYPKFKKKGIKDSFSLSNDQFRVNCNKIEIPNLGWVTMNEKLRFDGKMVGAVVSACLETIKSPTDGAFCGILR